MGFINTKEDLKKEIVACVTRRCKASSVPYPLRKLSADFSRCWPRIGARPRELCEELEKEGLLTIHEPIRGGTLLISNDYVEWIKANFVNPEAKLFDRLMDYDNALIKLADSAIKLHSPSRKDV